jgi:hypothetical protein
MDRPKNPLTRTDRRLARRLARIKESAHGIIRSHSAAESRGGDFFMGLSLEHESTTTRRTDHHSAFGMSGTDTPRPAESSRTKTKSCVAFRAELDLAELDDRGRPGSIWTGRATEISRALLIVRSRRMCYEGRELLVAVHLVDDKPTALYGIVDKSEYDGDGLYRTAINLQRLPQTDAIRTWISTLIPRREDRRA